MTMKRLKSLFIIVVLLLILSISTSCQNGTPEPDIKIFNASNELELIHYGDRYNKEEKDIEKMIKSVMVGERFIDLPMINFGEKIEIDALNFETEEFEFYNYIVDINGNIVSDYSVEPFIISSVNNDDYIFFNNFHS